MNLTEDDYNMLKAQELQELNDWFDLEEKSWENNPARILLEKQIEDIGKQIDELIDWNRK